MKNSGEDNEHMVNRRDFIKLGGTILGGTVLSSIPNHFIASAKELGPKVPPMKFTTTTASFDPVRPQSARAICREFRQELGWEVQANPFDYNKLIDKVLFEKDYDMYIIRLTGANVRIDPNVFLYKIFHSSQIQPGGWNSLEYSNPELDKLLEKQQTTLKKDKRRPYVYEAQEVIHENQPNNALVYPQMTNAYRSDKVENLVPMMGEGIGSFWTDLNIKSKRSDGYVRTGVTTPLKSLNPISITDAMEFKELRMIYDRLFRINREGLPEPWAAKSYDIPEPTIINVELREGMKFHDGVDVTAQDVEFTFDYYKKWEAPWFLDSLEFIKNVETKGEYSLQFTLEKPYAPILSNLFSTVFILPQHIWKDIPEESDVDDPLNFANEKPVGSGPFKFEHWEREAELKVAKFEEHFNPPNCQGIMRLTYGGHTALASAIERGECDRTRYILKPNLVKDLDRLDNVVGKGYPSHGLYHLGYHTTRSPLDDATFRKALAYVLPKKFIRDAILGEMADIGGSVIAPANKYWHNPEVKPFKYNPEKARSILEDAGYRWDDNGVLHFPKEKE